jgi:membrane-associated phospholipid phosphatase
MKDYESFYQSITQPYLDKRRRQGLLLLNKLLTAIMYLAYPCLLIFLFVTNRHSLMKNIFIPGLSFVGLSLFRHILNSPRPYECYCIKPLIYKETHGHSFPSRHVFSSAMIAMCYFYQNAFLGIILLLMTVIEGYIRVVGGVHFIKDVVAGMLIGIGCGLLLWI